MNSGIVFKRTITQGVVESKLYNLQYLQTGQEIMVTNMQSGANSAVTIDSTGTGSEFVLSQGGNSMTTLVLASAESATFFKVNANDIVCLSSTGKFS